MYVTLSPGATNAKASPGKKTQSTFLLSTGMGTYVS